MHRAHKMRAMGNTLHTRDKMTEHNQHQDKQTSMDMNTTTMVSQSLFACPGGCATRGKNPRRVKTTKMARAPRPHPQIHQRTGGWGLSCFKQNVVFSNTERLLTHDDATGHACAPCSFYMKKAESVQRSRTTNGGGGRRHKGRAPRTRPYTSRPQPHTKGAPTTDALPTTPVHPNSRTPQANGKTEPSKQKRGHHAATRATANKPPHPGGRTPPTTTQDTNRTGTPPLSQKAGAATGHRREQPQPTPGRGHHAGQPVATTTHTRAHRSARAKHAST